MVLHDVTWYHHMLLLQDGRLCKNDQVLSVNKQHLLGHSNQEAMDILRQALSNRNTVHLVVARRTVPPSPSMGALGEEPEEVGVVIVVFVLHVIGNGDQCVCGCGITEKAPFLNLCGGGCGHI